MKKKIVLMMLLAIVLIMAGCGKKAVQTSEQVSADASEVVTDSVTDLNGQENQNSDDSRENLEAGQDASRSTQPIEVSMVMVGDILAHEGVYNSGLQEDGTYQFDHLFANVKKEVAGADIAIANQETILGGTQLGLSGYPCFNSPCEMADSLVSAGFDIVCHATNHALDKGLEGVENCLQYWKSRYPQMAVLGLNETEEDVENIYIYEKEGFRIAFLNYTYGTNGIPIPESKPYLVNVLSDERVTKDVTKAKKMADFVVVLPHWGTEYVTTTDSSQKHYTDLFLQLGVDLVIGTHPHVIEPVEMLQREDGHQMLVYYSLGNFVSNQDMSSTMVGAMAQVTVCKDQDRVYIENYQIQPLITHKVFGRNAITTYKIQDYTEELAAQNRIHADAAGQDFSLQYCKTLCRQVFGSLYREDEK